MTTDKQKFTQDQIDQQRAALDALMRKSLREAEKEGTAQDFRQNRLTVDAYNARYFWSDENGQMFTAQHILWYGEGAKGQHWQEVKDMPDHVCRHYSDMFEKREKALKAGELDAEDRAELRVKQTRLRTLVRGALFGIVVLEKTRAKDVTLKERNTMKAGQVRFTPTRKAGDIKEADGKTQYHMPARNTVKLSKSVLGLHSDSRETDTTANYTVVGSCTYLDQMLTKRNKPTQWGGDAKHALLMLKARLDSIWTAAECEAELEKAERLQAEREEQEAAAQQRTGTDG